MRRRGFTLIELMVVVAIIAILATLSAATLSSVNELGKLNGSAQTVANILRTARTRAITERCTYVVQINGANYNPLGPADVPRKPGTIIVWRKNDCQSVTGAYEPGLAVPLRDRLVNDYSMQEFGSTIFLPAGVITEPLNQLRTGSLSIAWQPNGTRTVWADSDADGVSAVTPLAVGATLDLTIRTPKATVTPSRSVSVPPDGPAVAP
ncbi:MAG: prepilin-type N-terminal cleavage/methylation domain-containing protein [Myxococcus sp.]|nr:prepilin-type N-terminal cleavage/methylation domain-containing protein [Myxococcus sp.]